MPWWGWITIAAILLGAEMMLIDAQFYLVFLGLAAFAVGLGVLAGIGEPVWMQWLVFGILSVVFMVGFRARVYQKLRGETPGYSADVDGQILKMDDALAPNAETRVDFRGSSWRVRNAGTEAINPGDLAVIERTEGLILHVRRAD